MEEYRMTFVRLAKWVPGVLYEPVGKNRKQRIAVLVMHMDEDYLTFVSGKELAKRGYTVLCANPVMKEGFVYGQPEKTRSVGLAVEYLRSLPQVEKIILLGHSSGGTLMSGYQAIAENGSQIFQGPDYIYPYPFSEELPPADGIMYLDSNYGNAVMQLFSIDPAVADEKSGKMIHPDLDLFRTENGFRMGGCRYDREFVNKFQREQSRRNCELIEYALNRQLLLDFGNGLYEDDEPMIIPGSAGGFYNNKLYAQDVSLMSRTRREHLLLHGDGSRTREIIRCRRAPRNFESRTPFYREGARTLSVRSFLSTFAVRTEKDYGFDEDHVWGIEWESTYNTVPGNTKYIHVPVLVLGMAAGWEFLASETIYEYAESTDKTIAFVEGARHSFVPAKHQEAYPGEFGDTVKTIHDYVDEWLSAGRFD
jgi:hypothetical protein